MLVHGDLIEIQFQGGESLAETIVQLAGDFAALGVLQLEKATA